MISDKHKDTTFSSLLNHYQHACRRALSAIPDIKKAFVNFLVETLMLFVLLPRKANFSQMEIYGNYCKKTFRKNFSKPFSWIDFNIELGKHLFQTSARKAIAIDPSYISKSGKHTQRMKRSARKLAFEAGAKFVTRQSQVRHRSVLVRVCSGCQTRFGDFGHWSDRHRQQGLRLAASRADVFSEVPGRMWAKPTQMVSVLHPCKQREADGTFTIHRGRLLLCNIRIR